MNSMRLYFDLNPLVILVKILLMLLTEVPAVERTHRKVKLTHFVVEALIVQHESLHSDRFRRAVRVPESAFLSIELMYVRVILIEPLIGLHFLHLHHKISLFFSIIIKTHKNTIL